MLLDKYTELEKEVLQQGLELLYDRLESIYDAIEAFVDNHMTKEIDVDLRHEEFLLRRVAQGIAIQQEREHLTAALELALVYYEQQLEHTQEAYDAIESEYSESVGYDMNFHLKEVSNLLQTTKNLLEKR